MRLASSYDTKWGRMSGAAEFFKGLGVTTLGALAAIVVAAAAAIPFILIVGNLGMAFGLAEAAAEGFATVAYLVVAVCLVAGGIVLALLAAGCERVLATGALVVPASGAALVGYAGFLDRTGFDPGGPVAALWYATVVLVAAALVARLVALVSLPPLARLAR